MKHGGGVAGTAPKSPFALEITFVLPEAMNCGIVRELIPLNLIMDATIMPGEQQVYNLKVDSSGRIALPSDVRQRRHIENGDTVVVIEDDAGLHITTREQLLAEVQAHFAKHVPRGVLLSDEVNEDRRSEIERD
jgi:AbrB family looped-hinge helix DNA binding protein